MKIIVNPHDIEIQKKDKVNENEYKITKCEFEFSEEYTNDLVKVALFTNSKGTYKVYIVNNECDIPAEILSESGNCTLGVYAYKVEEIEENGETTEELKLRYSPEEIKFYIDKGSYRENATNSEPITPTDKEQMEQAISDMETKVDNLDIEAEKVDKTTTITITRKDGTQEEIEILDGVDGIDGKSVEKVEIVGRNLNVTYGGETENLGQVAPNIQVGTTTTITPSQPARVENVGTDINPIFNFYVPKGETGAVKIRIVNELPETGEEDTFYLVPKQDVETQDIYDEYIWINNAWELVGEKQIEVDLSDYAKKSELPTALSQLTDDSTHRLVTDTEKTTWNNKLDSSDLTDYVKNTDYATSSKGGVFKPSATYAVAVLSNGNLLAQGKTYSQYNDADGRIFVSKTTLENVITGKELVNKTYVDGFVGDIGEVLDQINGEVIGGA